MTKLRPSLAILLPLLAAGASPLIAATVLVSPVGIGNGSFIPCTAVGDVNGDSVTDIVAAAANAGSGSTHVIVYSGADNSVLYQCGPDSGFFGYGWALRPLGNYGGDATPDFASSAIFGGNGGAVFIVDGSNGAILHRIDAPSGDATDYFGMQFFMSNVTGSAAPDFIVGSPYGGTNGGHIFIYDGATRALVDTIEPPTAEASQAFTVYGIIPDLNNDGYDEIGAAAPNQTVSALANAGRAYIFSGINRTLYRTITLASPQANDTLNGPFPLGDLNADGKAEYACAYGNTGTRASAVIFSGIDGAVLDTINSPDTDASDFGRSIVGIADISGDTVNEIVIGTWAGGGSSSGTVYIYNGVTRALITSFSHPAGASSTFFGQGLSLMGDVDGDGKQDLAVPAPFHGDGRIYVYTHAGRPNFTVSSFAFGEYRVGGTHPELPVPVVNLGLSTVSLASLVVGGADASSFTLSSNPSPTNLSASQSVNFGITPSPSTPGIKSAIITANGGNGSSGIATMLMEAYARPTGPDGRLAYIAGENRVMLIDTVNGDRDIISGAGVGSGPVFNTGSTPKVTDVLIEDANNLIVVAGYKYFRVDRDTGARTELNASPVNDGVANPGDSITCMEWESPGVFIAMITGTTTRLTRVTLSSMTGQVVTSPSVGTGIGFSTYGSDMIIEPGGTILICDFAGQAIVRVDPTTGNRTKLNSSPIPYSVCITSFSPTEVALGEFSGLTRFLKYNLTTDVVTTIANGGFPISSINAIDRYNNGDLVAFDGGSYSLIRVNVTTGAKTFVATPTVGLGPTLPQAFYSEGAALRLVDKGGFTSDAAAWSFYR